MRLLPMIAALIASAATVATAETAPAPYDPVQAAAQTAAEEDQKAGKRLCNFVLTGGKGLRGWNALCRQLRDGIDGRQIQLTSVKLFWQTGGDGCGAMEMEISNDVQTRNLSIFGQTVVKGDPETVEHCDDYSYPNAKPLKPKKNKDLDVEKAFRRFAEDFEVDKNSVRQIIIYADYYYAPDGSGPDGKKIWPMVLAAKRSGDAFEMPVYAFVCPAEHFENPNCTAETAALPSPIPEESAAAKQWPLVLVHTGSNTVGFTNYVIKEGEGPNDPTNRKLRVTYRYDAGGTLEKMFKTQFCVDGAEWAWGAQEHYFNHHNGLDICNCRRSSSNPKKCQ